MLFRNSMFPYFSSDADNGSGSTAMIDDDVIDAMIADAASSEVEDPFDGDSLADEGETPEVVANDDETPEITADESEAAAVVVNDDVVAETASADADMPSGEPAADVPVEDAAPTGPAFRDLGLTNVLLESIEQVGFKTPTPVQAETIPLLLEGHDVIAHAQTGSGKTAAFGLPIIEAIDPQSRGVQALVLCPTRELAIQVSEALRTYGAHKRIETLPIYGGQAYERQFRGLQRGVQIVVGTPGRVMDHMRRGTLRLDDVRFFVLDEADEMLDMGFVDDIETILEEIPAERQTALFSATMPPRIAELANTYLRDPKRVSVRGKEMTVAEIHQSSYEFPRGKKVEALTRILEAESPRSAMIFCRTKHGVDELGENLLQRGFAVETLHGDLSQVQRDRVMRRFRTGQANLLIATDVAARGLDIPDVSHVINYDVPESAETYVHRIGRTGRAGRAGEAITLISPREFRWVRQVERVTRATIEPRRLPSQEDVNVRRREKLKAIVLDAVADEEAFALYLDPIRALSDDMDAEKLAAALLHLYAEETGQARLDTDRHDELANFGGKFQRDRDRDRDRQDHRGEPRERAPRGSRAPLTPEAGMTKLFVNLGHNVRVRPQDFVGAIANEANISGSAVGAIDIFESYSLVDVPSDVHGQVIDALNAASIKGKGVTVQVASEELVESMPSRPRGGRPGGPRRDGGFNRGPRRDGGSDRGGRREGGFDRGPRREGGFDRGPRREGGFDRGPRQQDGFDRGGRRADDGPRGPRGGFDRPQHDGGRESNRGGYGRPDGERSFDRGPRHQGGFSRGNREFANPERAQFERAQREFGKRQEQAQGAEGGFERRERGEFEDRGFNRRGPRRER